MRGHYLRRVLPRSFARGGVTYTPACSFAPVAGTKLRLGVAFADKDRVVETISSVGSLSAVDASVYHRLDLQSGVAKCKHLDQPATKTTSVFKLAPEAFKQPAVCVVGVGVPGLLAVHHTTLTGSVHPDTWRRRRTQTTSRNGSSTLHPVACRGSVATVPSPG